MVSGGGCRAPFEFKDVMDRALKNLVEKGQGMAEFAWHFNNFKWVEWFASFGCIHKSFGNFDDHRHWVYQYDAADCLSTGMCAFCTRKTLPPPAAPSASTGVPARREPALSGATGGRSTCTGGRPRHI